VTPGSDGENKTYTLKYTVTGRPFLGPSNDVNMLSFHYPDIHLGTPGKYVLELDRVDIDAYCASGSVYDNGTDQVYYLTGRSAPYWTAWPNFGIRGTTADATKMILSGVGTPNAATPGKLVLLDKIADGANVVAGMYMVTRAQRSYVLTINSDFSLYVVNGSQVTVPVTTLSGFPAGTPPMIAGGTIRIDVATGYPAGFYTVVACTGTSMTFEFGSVAPTPVAPFTGEWISYVEVIHGLPYTPGPFGGIWSILGIQNNFVAETKMCLSYAPRFTTTMAVGRTFGNMDRTDSTRVVLDDTAVTQAWDALGTTVGSGTGVCCDSFGKGNGPSNKYRLKQTYSNPWKTTTTSTRGAVVPFDTLSFQLRMDDSWIAQSEAPRWDVTNPQDFLVDKTYYFTLRPYFLH
jgi:hypothetical protein